MKLRIYRHVITPSLQFSVLLFYCSFILFFLLTTWTYLGDEFPNPNPQNESAHVIIAYECIEMCPNSMKTPKSKPCTNFSSGYIPGDWHGEPRLQDCYYQYNIIIFLLKLFDLRPIVWSASDYSQTKYEIVCTL